jgi:NDP-sugar pyrophosphorylase family protein
MSFEAIVLAGGKGTRLAPFTHVLPKPLLPVGERPILDLVLTQLGRAGCTKATLAVGHLGHLIEIYCGTGDRWGMEIGYFRETTPLGTVGALSQLEALPDAPFVVMNGDVLSDLSFVELLEAHAGSDAALTIGAFRRRERDELGILDVADDGALVAYREKPEHEYLVSMGIYAFSPTTVELIPAGERMDFPDLVQALLAAERPVQTHVHSDYWLDLGRPDDFARANEEFADVRERLGV